MIFWQKDSGTGTIIFRSEIVKGLTTAATIWAMSAVPVRSSAIMATSMEPTTRARAELKITPL